MLAADPRSAQALARRCLLAGFTGPRVPDWLAGLLAEGLGGVVLFASNVVDDSHLADLTADLRAAGTDVVIAIDEEGGEVTRLDAATGSTVPGAAALGAVDDVAATESVYATLGRRLAAAGVTMDLAPVADVNSNPGNPVIGVRAFGADPDLVARHVAAAVRGIQGTGVAASAKHFPGHGDTTTDTHRAVARIDRSRAQLDAVDLMPFRAAIAAGVRSIMTGHLLVRSLDEHRLGTLSPHILTTLLRDELGFTGAVITDALEMRAVADSVGMVEGAVQALIAGADALCIGSQEHRGAYAEIPAAVAAAVESGRLPISRLRQAAERATTLSVLDEQTGAATPLDTAALARLAARSVSVVGQLPALRRPHVFQFHGPGSEAADALRWSPAGLIAAALPGAEVLADPAGLATDRDAVVVVRDASRHPEQATLLKTLAATRRAAVVVVEVGWPGPVEHGLPTVQTHGTAPLLLEAAAQLISRGMGVQR